jgi:hypothetical protein
MSRSSASRPFGAARPAAPPSRRPRPLRYENHCIFSLLIPWRVADRTGREPLWPRPCNRSQGKAQTLANMGLRREPCNRCVLLPDPAALIRAAGTPPSGPAMPRHRVAEHRFALDCSGSLSQRARRIKPADRTNLLWPRARQGTPGDADRWARRVMGQPRTGAPDRRRPWRGRCARQVRASSANLVVSSGASGRERLRRSLFLRVPHAFNVAGRVLDHGRNLTRMG